MKKSIVLAILGIAVAAVPSYGNGYVFFCNYFNSTSPTINFAPWVTPPSKAGLAAGGAMAAELLWFNGLTQNPAALTLVAGSSTPFATPPGNVADGDLASGAGYFFGPVATLPGYTSGLVTLQVEVFGTEAEYSYFGQSALFTMTPATGITPVPEFNQNQVGPGAIQYNPYSYSGDFQGVPEPMTPALGALGGLSLCMFRRRK
jgi:hypothetical protein